MTGYASHPTSRRLVQMTEYIRADGMLIEGEVLETAEQEMDAMQENIEAEAQYKLAIEELKRLLGDRKV